MARIVRSPQAEQDLTEIGSYIALDNLNAALRLLDIIDEKVRLLADMPQLGQLRNELAPMLRSFAVGSYLLFYRPIDGGIELVRVLHGARNLKPLFE